MLFLLSTPAFALDCTGLDAEVCDAVNDIATLIENAWGSPVVADDAPKVRLRTASLYDRLLELDTYLDANGCTVDGVVGGAYLNRVSFDGEWLEDSGDTGPHSGSLHGSAIGNAFTGSYSGSRSGTAGDVYGHYTNREFVGNRDSDAFFAGGFETVAGRRGVYFGFSGTCSGVTPRILDGWYGGTLWPYYPMRMFASTPWINPLTGIATMDQQCQDDWDALGDGTTAVFKAAVTDIPNGILSPHQRFRNGPAIVLAGSEIQVAPDVRTWFDYDVDVPFPLDVEADGMVFDWDDGDSDAITWWGYNEMKDPYPGFGFGDCEGWTNPASSASVLGGIPLTDIRRQLAYFVTCSDLIDSDTVSRTICVEDTDPTDD